MTILVAEVPVLQRFKMGPSWLHLIEQQLTTAIVEGESAVTIDLLYYICQRVNLAYKPGALCTITLDQFQRFEARRYGILPSACLQVWNTFDWQHAVTPSCE